MNIQIALAILNTVLAHAAELSAIVEKAHSEGRTDLTDAEVAVVRGGAVAASKHLGDDLAVSGQSAASQPGG